MRIDALSYQHVFSTDTMQTLTATTGLVAIVGPNGSGKTTLLEAMVAPIYRRWPSRGDLIKGATSPMTQMLLMVTLEGRGTYSITINMDSVKRHTDAVISQVVENVHTPLNDGKVTTFDAVVKSLFPAWNVLLASAFASQDRVGSFVRLDKKGRKELFAELLGLAHYEAVAARGGAMASHSDKHRARLSTLIGADQERLAGQTEDDFTARMENGHDELALRTETLAVSRAKIEALHAESTTLKAELQASSRAQAQQRLLLDRLAERTKDLFRLGESDAKMEQQMCVSEDLHKRQLETTLDHVDEQEAGLMTDAALIEQWNHERAKVDKALADTAKLRLTAITQHEHLITRAQQAIANAKQAACEGRPPYDTCVLLNLSGHHQDITHAQAAIADLKVPITPDYTASQAAYEAALVLRDSVRETLQKRRRTARRHYAKDMADLTAERTDCQHDSHAQHQTFTSHISALNEALEQMPEVDDSALTARASTVETNLTSLRSMEPQLVRALTQQEMLIAQLEQDQLAFLAAQASLVARRRQLARADAQTLAWSTIAKVCGREGLPTLEIDAAGPGVSALANDLLMECFGGRFQVELVTQELKVGGKGYKEAFELKVWDLERHGAARDLADLSGGEQVLVDESLKSAIALFVNQHHGNPIRTCWRDETTGALDGDNALRYVAMLRRIQQLGGFEVIYFVSHNPEATALADAQIQVGG